MDLADHTSLGVALPPRPKSPKAEAARRSHAGLHILFWIAVLIFYTVYFGRVHARYGDSLLFVGLLLPITIGTTYFLTRFLVPRYLLKRRYGLFGLHFVYALIVSVDLELILVSHLLYWIAVSRREAMNPAAYDVYNLIVGMYLVVFLGLAVDLLGRWFRMQRANQELERKQLEAALKLKEAELKLLKSQIEPHFLFNTLNSLYALTLERSEKAPNVVLQLSELLDYVVHRSAAPRVSLAEELQTVRTYVALERIRFGPRADVRFDVTPVDESRHVAPLLLIPLVENAFKHGVGRRSQPTIVRIDARLADGRFHFRIENDAGFGEEEDARREPGVGLSNLRRRLELQYPGRHRFEAGAQGDTFVADLLIDLDDAKSA